MSKVISLSGQKVNPPGQPVPEVIDFLERILARAKSGDIRAVAVAYVRGNGMTADGWYSDRNDGKLTFILHSAIACLMGDFTADLNKSSISVPVDEDAS
jgi:hypothetical protein